MTSISFAEDFNIDELMGIDSHMAAKDYQEVAKFYGMDMFPKEKNCSGGSHIQTFVKNKSREGVLEINWFSNGYVITELCGEQKGNQTIVWRGEVFATNPSPSFCFKGGETIYRYDWGIVNTFLGGCSIHLTSMN